MKILHTSDWHLGALLEEASREPDHRAFLDWLLEAVEAHGVDLLLVAGDVFDTATPSAEAQRLYYRFLHRLQGTRVRQVVVVGGNHDSAARLDAPSELLASLRVHVVGGLDSLDHLERCLCPVPGPGGEVEAVVVAVPFVHEWRLGYRSVDGEDTLAQEALGAPFQRLYTALADLAEARWPGVPQVATGHLAVAGSERSDAPQEIHLIGSLGGLPPGIFDPRFAYIALGHIHRAYRIGDSRAWYSGSPIALSMKEGQRPRTVNRVDLHPSGTVEVCPVPVPDTRQLLTLAGTPPVVQAQLRALTWTESLPPMVQVELWVEAFEVGLEEQVRSLVASLDPRPLLVALTQRPRRAAEPMTPEALPLRLLDLEPRQVFQRLCVARGEDPSALQGAFEQLLAQEVEA